MKIRILPESVVRLIRAGEVIERPASVVKELIENALDAGARFVRISAVRGGREHVCVEDDGHGMAPTDLAISIERHATSKIGGRDDLDAISTLGFRGEALSSIAAVADLVIVTRSRDGDCAWTMSAGPSGTREPTPCAGRDTGTRVWVSGIFSSHPARAAFLKAPRTEMSAIRSVVEDAALANPDVAFSLETDGRIALSLGVASGEDRAKAVRGAVFAANCLPFSAEANGVSVRGLVGLPTWKEHGSGHQSVSVNGRAVTDKVVAAAIRSAFGDVSGELRPAAVVDIRLHPSEVDVNCHPSKATVRFRSPTAISDLVRTAVRDALAGGSVRASAELGEAASRAATPLSLSDDGDRRRLPLGRALGVALGGYAVCERGDGIVLVDLHAAAERAAYERLMAEVEAGGVASRVLREPVILSVGHAAAAAFDARTTDLRRVGLHGTAMDDTSVAIISVPAFILDADVAALGRKVAAGLAADPHGAPMQALLSRTCASLACHAAFRFGDTLDPVELDALLREFERTPRISTCMHGRPTLVEMPRERVAQLFGRR